MGCALGTLFTIGAKQMSFEMEVGLIVLTVVLASALLDIFFEAQLEAATLWVLDATERACTHIDTFFEGVDRKIDAFFDNITR